MAGCFRPQGIGIDGVSVDGVVMNVGGGLAGREELGDGAWFKRGREFDRKRREDVEGMKRFKRGCLEGNGLLGSG